MTPNTHMSYVRYLIYKVLVIGEASETNFNGFKFVTTNFANTKINSQRMKYIFLFKSINCQELLDKR